LFNALGDHYRPRLERNVANRAQELLLEGVKMDVAHKIHVDLDVFGLELRPAAQAGIALTQVIDGQLEARASIRREQAGEMLAIMDGVLCQFEDDPGRRQAQALEVQGHGLAVAGKPRQCGRTNVEKQLAGQAKAGKAAQQGLAATQLEIDGQAVFARHPEQVQRRTQRAPGGAADEPLVAYEGSPLQVDNGLEHRHEPVMPQDVAQAVEQSRLNRFPLKSGWASSNLVQRHIQRLPTFTPTLQRAAIGIARV